MCPNHFRSHDVVSQFQFQYKKYAYFLKLNTNEAF